jgi:hypothetical protein
VLRRVTIIVTIASSTIAFAQPNDNPLAEAEARAKKNDFVGAAAQFKLAYAKDPRPELICNVGVAYFKAKELARAQLFLSRCLERGSALDAKFVDNVRVVLGSVETSLRQGDFTPVDIVITPPGATITLDDDESFVGSRLVWVPFGMHRFYVHSEGYSGYLIELDAKTRDVVHFKAELQRPAPVEATPPPPVKVEVPTPVPTPARPHQSTSAHRSLVLPIASSAVAGAAATVVVIAFGRAHDAADRAAFAVSPDVYQHDVDRTNNWNTIMGASAAVALIGAGASGYLWFRATHTSSPVEVEPTSGGVAFRVSARW